MSYWGNCGDALSIYAMCDMYGVHCCVITHTKPWTTVANTFKGTAMDVLRICQVNLIYLGNNKFGKLVKKAGTSSTSYHSASYNYLPMLQQPAPPPLIKELKTANTLLNLQSQGSASTPHEPPAFEGPPVPKTADAMDKIVGRFDVCQSTVLKLNDAMDQIVSGEPSDSTLNVETTETVITPPIYPDVMPIQRQNPDHPLQPLRNQMTFLLVNTTLNHVPKSRKVILIGFPGRQAVV